MELPIDVDGWLYDGPEDVPGADRFPGIALANRSGWGLVQVSYGPDHPEIRRVVRGYFGDDAEQEATKVAARMQRTHGYDAPAEGGRDVGSVGREFTAERIVLAGISVTYAAHYKLADED